jgi:hypothetical protein
VTTRLVNLGHANSGLRSIEYYNNNCHAAGILGPAVSAIICVMIGAPKNDQTAILADWDLVGINLENASLERERSSYMLFTMLPNTLLNKLVCTVEVSASRAFHTVSMSIDFYVEVRFHLGGLLGRNRSQSCKFNAFRCQYRLRIAWSTGLLTNSVAVCATSLRAIATALNDRGI